jgi:cellulose synthase/poly-beta-1,6-N-acetylglucosamine synthase-like glycosyltransferase
MMERLPMEVFGDRFLTSGLVFYALGYGAAIFLVMVRNELSGKLMLWLNRGLFGLTLIWVIGTAAGLSGDVEMMLVHLFYTSLLLVMLWVVLPGFHQAGRLLMLTNFLFYFFALGWGLLFIVTLPVSGLTKSLFLAGLPLLAVSLPVTLVQFFEQYEIICRRQWNRPRDPLRVDRLTRFPKVSLHVPAHAEPPKLVKATLDRLAALDYPNFEVLVIDNNTEEEALWQPVEAYCQELGERFRFFRLTNWPGAKAGALNYALKQTAKDAEIVGVVDADYQAHRMFLKTLVGYFEDPKMGFVQTPHDYRDFAGRAFLTNCYFEYEWFFRTQMVSLNERNAGITVGTMCLIRKEALAQAGGWSEWCLTEDSELAIRIHALGYTSVYTKTSFGKGLIPETFEGYKKQRFRWTAGPIQELKHHFWLLLPWADEKKSRLTLTQRIEHLVHGLQNVAIGFSSLLIPVNMAAVVSMLYHGEEIAVPLVLWVAASVTLLSAVVLTWYVYRRVIGAGWRETAGGLAASYSLHHVITVASLLAIVTNSFKWQRTNKFKEAPAAWRALQSAGVELAIGLTAMGFGIGMIAGRPGPGLWLMLAIGLVIHGAMYLTAPYMAWLSERELK